MARRTQYLWMIVALVGATFVTRPASAALPVETPACGTTVDHSFVLGANVTCPDDNLWIEVTAPDVTVDLGGHSVSGNGVDDTGGTESAIITSSPDTRVKNGIITAFEEGIDLDEPRGRVIGVTAYENHSYGFGLFGDDMLIADSVSFDNGRGLSVQGKRNRILRTTIFDNTGDGMFATFSERVEVRDSLFSDNGGRGAGVFTSGGKGNAIVVGNTMNYNTTDGLFVDLDNGGTARVNNNEVSENDADGLDLTFTTGAVRGNTAAGNLGHGISAEGTGFIENNRVVDGIVGIDSIGSDVTIASNRVSTTTDHGIRTNGARVAILDNRVAESVSGNGIQHGGGSATIARNVSRYNLTGILANSTSGTIRVNGNRANGNRADGIDVIAVRGTVNRNTANGNGFGTANVGLGIDASEVGILTGEDNIAMGNEDPDQCDPVVIC